MLYIKLPTCSDAIKAYCLVLGVLNLLNPKFCIQDCLQEVLRVLLLYLQEKSSSVDSERLSISITAHVAVWLKSIMKSLFVTTFKNTYLSFRCASFTSFENVHFYKKSILRRLEINQLVDVSMYFESKCLLPL